MKFKERAKKMQIQDKITVTLKYDNDIIKVSLSDINLDKIREDNKISDEYIFIFKEV